MRHQRLGYGLLLGLIAASTACSDASKGTTTGTGTTEDVGRISFALKAPEAFVAPFCVGITVAAADFAPPIRVEQTYPAGTVVIETVVPNIPVGTDRKVELGIFKNGTCAPALAEGDWHGAADGVVIDRGKVTLVDLVLAAKGSQGNTGSVIVRGTSRFSRKLHAEVVDAQSNPIAQALCHIFDEDAQIATALSGATPKTLGVIDTEVTVATATSVLRLECEHAKFGQAVKNAVLLADPADPALGTFVATVILDPRVEILVSNTQRLTFRLRTAPFQFAKQVTPAGEFHRIVRQDSAIALRHGNEFVGQPETPVFTTSIALPLDGQADVAITPEGEAVVRNLRLYPIQKSERAATGLNPGDPYPNDGDKFFFDEAIYARTSVDVRKPASFQSSPGGDSNIFDLSLNLLDVSPNGVVQHSSLLVDVRFSGGSSCFRSTRVASQFDMDAIDQRIEADPPTVLRPVVNAELLVTQICPVIVQPIFFGARFVIVAPPALLNAANSLKAHKGARGISTHVVSTTAISATTALTDTALKGYLINAYNNWWIRPRWVLLMGDAEHIPTHYDAANAWDTARNAGDQFYGQLGGATSLPVFGIGRMPVDTLAQAQAVVDKVKAFENSPPFGLTNPYYARQTFAAEFQDDDLNGQADRWFAETSEHIRGYQLGLGRNVQRIYRAPAGSSPTLWRDGGAVPWYLRKPHFPWNGTTTEVINAVNAGTSILYHRNHGWWSGWGTPSLSTTNLSSMAVSGNQFPIVFSINCASGIFDNETVDLPANRIGAGYGPNVGSVYWAEEFLRKADGALAIVGDTRSSSTVLNNDIAKGLFDALTPAYLAYGSASPIRRLGDVLNAAKGYVKSRGHSAGDLAQQMVIYNLLGDPTLDYRTNGPTILSLAANLISQAGVQIQVRATENQALPEDLVVVALAPDGEVLARSPVGSDGTAQLPIAATKGITIVASSADAVPATAEVAER